MRCFSSTRLSSHWESWYMYAFPFTEYQVITIVLEHLLCASHYIWSLNASFLQTVYDPIGQVSYFILLFFFFNGLDKWSESSSNLLNATQMKMVQLFGNNCSAFTKMHFLFLLDTQLDYIFQPCLTMEVEISSSSRKLMAGYFQAWHIKTTYMILCFLFFPFTLL